MRAWEEDERGFVRKGREGRWKKKGAPHTAKAVKEAYDCDDDNN